MSEKKSQKRILIVEDEQAIREMIQFSFYHEDFILDEAEHVKEARQHLSMHKPDLILLDWMLPGKFTC